MPLLLPCAQPDSMHSGPWQSSLFALSLSLIHSLLFSPLHSCFHSIPSIGITGPCQGRREPDPVHPLGDASDLIRYPVRRFAFGKTTENSGQPVGNVWERERLWIPVVTYDAFVRLTLPTVPFQLQCQVLQVNHPHRTLFCLKTTCRKHQGIWLLYLLPLCP